MQNKNVIKFIEEFLIITLISLMGCAVIIFSLLNFEIFLTELSAAYFDLISIITVFISIIITILSIIFLRKNKNAVFKLFFVLLFSFCLLAVLIYNLKIFGILDNVRSVTELRNYVLNFGAFAPIIYIILQFLQVVAVPIPSLITITAGVLVFGALKCAVYSLIGIILGSITAFGIGKFFGEKLIRWVIGDKKFNKLLNKFNGKSSVFLTLAFLLPCFPDDLLCFFAGATKLKFINFFLIVIFARSVSIFTSAMSIGNRLIPYNTWWGILLWLIIVCAVCCAAAFITNKNNTIKN